MIIIVWIVFALICALPAQKKPIGLGLVFILGIIFSPLIGLIIALASKDAPQEIKISYYDELLKLSTLKEQGAITEEEFLREKGKLVNPADKIVITGLKSLNLAKSRGEITQEEYLKKLQKMSIWESNH